MPGERPGQLGHGRGVADREVGHHLQQGVAQAAPGAHGRRGHAQLVAAHGGGRERGGGPSQDDEEAQRYVEDLFMMTEDGEDEQSCQISPRTFSLFFLQRSSSVLVGLCVGDSRLKSSL